MNDMIDAIEENPIIAAIRSEKKDLQKSHRVFCNNCIFIVG